MLGIGFDSGGSHTTYALNRGDGPVRTESNECSDSIADARGSRSTRAAINWIMRVIQSQPDDDICAWIGAAGFSGASSTAIHDAFEPFIAELQEEGRNIEILIANDAVSLLKAPPLNGKGVAAIVGTGSVVMGTHPMCPTGIVQRGGFEWLVSDEGAGVWMTLECIRLVIKDIQTLGSEGYHSPLLDRLCDYFGIESGFLATVPEAYLPFARADLLARTVSEGRAESKRKIAGFVYPHLFDLASLQVGKTHDRLAAEVLSSSVRRIASDVDQVSTELAAYTADSANARERLPLVVAGNIAKNPAYEILLKTQVSESKYINSITALGDAAEMYASLAYEYVGASGRVQREIARSFDPLHAVLKLT